MDNSIIITIISTSCIAIISHFIALGRLKDKLHSLELKITKLENKDNLQQQTIDKLNQLYPLFEEAFKSLNKRKK